MTDRHSVIFYLMFAGMVANIVSILIDKHSFYDHLKHSYMHDIQEEDEVEPVIDPSTAKVNVDSTTA